MTTYTEYEMRSELAALRAEEHKMFIDDKIRERVAALATELPGITFGYIGNCGVDRTGQFDDRSWRVFLPHPGRVGTYADCVSLGATDRLSAALENWAEVEQRVRVQYARRVK